MNKSTDVSGTPAKFTKPGHVFTGIVIKPEGAEHAEIAWEAADKPETEV